MARSSGGTSVTLSHSRNIQLPAASGIQPPAFFKALGISAVLLSASGCSMATPQPAAAPNLPAVAPATALSLTELYRLPVGPYGLEPTEKLLSLDHQRVRIQGYMVRQDEPYEGLFLLASQPVNLAERADGGADDLPPGTVFVHLPSGNAGAIPAYRPGPIAVIGVLDLGARQENFDRISYVRLRLDALTIDVPSSPLASAAAGQR